MRQTRKGNQWYFGMKARAGVDAESGLVHSVIGTPANVADVTVRLSRAMLAASIASPLPGRHDLKIASRCLQ